MGLNLWSATPGQISVRACCVPWPGWLRRRVLVWKSSLVYVPAIIVSVVLAFVVGLAVRRAGHCGCGGLYLALVTLAVGAIFPGLLRRFASLTNGDNGIFNLQWQPRPGPGCTTGGAANLGFWVLAAARHRRLLMHTWSAAVSAGLFWQSATTRSRRPRQAIRISTVKALTFAVAGALGALGGALMVASIGVIRRRSSDSSKASNSW